MSNDHVHPLRILLNGKAREYESEDSVRRNARRCHIPDTRPRFASGPSNTEFLNPPGRCSDLSRLPPPPAPPDRPIPSPCPRPRATSREGGSPRFSSAPFTALRGLRRLRFLRSLEPPTDRILVTTFCAPISLLLPSSKYVLERPRLEGAAAESGSAVSTATGRFAAAWPTHKHG